jgi:putative heme iron utilization protein
MAEDDMASAGGDDKPEALPTGLEARQLLRAARAGSLATSQDGQPFASLVTHACTPALDILLLLSSLSEHTRHLRHEARCALMVQGAPTGPNPQTTPRVTVTGLAERIEDAALKARWLAVHPYAAFYADFTDFALYRIVPQAGLLVGGFGRAARLRRDDLRPPEPAVAAFLAADVELRSQCNEQLSGALDRLAASTGGTGCGWRMVAVDMDGCDLAPAAADAPDPTVRRVAWRRPLVGADLVRAEIEALAGPAPDA